MLFYNNAPRLSPEQQKFFASYKDFEPFQYNDAADEFLMLSQHRNWKMGSKTQKAALRKLLIISHYSKNEDLIELSTMNDGLKNLALSLGIRVSNDTIDAKAGPIKGPPVVRHRIRQPIKQKPNVQKAWLEKAFQTGPDTKYNYSVARAKFLAEEFRQAIGNNEDILTDLQNICEDLGVRPVPEALNSCKNALKEVHVNIIDYINWKRYGHDRPTMFADKTELHKYSLKEKKTFPKLAQTHCKCLRYILEEFGEEEPESSDA